MSRLGIGPAFHALRIARVLLRHRLDALLVDTPVRGWLWLLDDRYRRAEVIELLPAWWQLVEP